MAGFEKYDVITTSQVDAFQSTTPFTLQGAQFQIGDYIVQEAGTGNLVGMAKDEFEKNHRKAKSWSRKPKAKTDGSTEGAAEGAAESAGSSEVGQTEAAQASTVQ